MRSIPSAFVRVLRVARLLLLLPLAAHAQAPYKDAKLPINARVQDLLGRMTLEEKFWQLFMLNGAIGDSGTDYSKGVFGLQWRGAANARADAEATNRMQRYLRDSTRLGIPMIPFEESVHQLMRLGSPVYPAAIGLAATFDTALVARVAAAMAMEARARGIRQVLSPVVNIATDVRWGRVQETYGEDPWLSSAMGRAFVREFERRGVITTPKHFVANVGDGGRDSYPIDLSTRQLEELHFPPFKSAIRDAGARSIMMSYNSSDGVPASQNRFLMRDKLKRDWGFSGIIISDQSAVGGATVLHRTEASTGTATKRAIEGGLDVVFQASWREHRPYLAAFNSAGIDNRAVDSAVARVLRAKFQLGLFDNPFVNVDSAAAWNRDTAFSQLSREAAEKAVVLLKNDGVLPLKSGAKVALLGNDAIEAALGDYTMVPDNHDKAAVTPIAIAFKKRTGEANVFVAGYGSRGRYEASTFCCEPWRGEYFANPRLEGAPSLVRNDQRLDFHWTLGSPGRGISNDWYSVRWTGRIELGNAMRIGVEGNDGYRLYVNGKLLIDRWLKQSYHTVYTERIERGTHDVRLEFREMRGNGRIRLLHMSDSLSTGDFTLRTADEAVKNGDVVVVAAGIKEGEFRDRSSLSLPDDQEELILRAAATGKPVVVVLIGGSAITMSRWVDKVSAVVDAWYPGELSGEAIARVLYGDVNPAGRLPITFPISEGQLPLVYNHKPTGRGDWYVDLSGEPLFPFGFGLSYSTFEYSALNVTPDTLLAGARATISFRVKNTGAVAGDEVPQLYVRDMLASVARPVLELKGFTRIRLAAGEEREVRFALSGADLSMLDEQMRWVTEPGLFRILVGASSRDIRLRGDLIVR